MNEKLNFYLHPLLNYVWEWLSGTCSGMGRRTQVSTKYPNNFRSTFQIQFCLLYGHIISYFYIKILT